MKQKHLVWALESLKTFEAPKLHLEQYPTSAEMAAEIVRAIDVDRRLRARELPTLAADRAR